MQEEKQALRERINSLLWSKKKRPARGHVGNNEQEDDLLNAQIRVLKANLHAIEIEEHLSETIKEVRRLQLEQKAYKFWVHFQHAKTQKDVERIKNYLKTLDNALYRWIGYQKGKQHDAYAKQLLKDIGFYRIQNLKEEEVKEKVTRILAIGSYPALTSASKQNKDDLLLKRWFDFNKTRFLQDGKGVFQHSEYHEQKLELTRKRFFDPQKNVSEFPTINDHF